MFAPIDLDDLRIWSVSAYLSSTGNCFGNLKNLLLEVKGGLVNAQISEALYSLLHIVTSVGSFLSSVLSPPSSVFSLNFKAGVARGMPEGHDRKWCAPVKKMRGGVSSDRDVETR